jgi:hypothetical protein
MQVVIIDPKKIKEGGIRLAHGLYYIDNHYFSML